MIRTRPTVLRLLAAAAALVLAPALPARAADKEITVGLIAPMTGNSGQYGVLFKNAIDLYLSNYTMRGRKVNLVVRDDQAIPREAASAAQEFAGNNDLYGVIGSFSSTASLAAAPILLRAGVVQISPSSSDPAFTKTGPFMFRMADTQLVQGPAVATYVKSKLGAKRVAVLYRQDDFGLVASDAFRKAAEAGGVNIVANEAVVSGTADFRPLITRLQAAKPDVVYVATFYADAATLAKQMDEAGFHPRVVTNSSVQSPQLIKLAGKSVEGWFTPTEFVVDSPKENVKKFVAAYRAKYGTEPDLFAAEAWDTIGILTKAMEDATAGNKPLTRDGIREALVKIHYNGVTGNVSYDADRDVDKGWSWLVIKDGRYQSVRTAQ